MNSLLRAGLGRINSLNGVRCTMQRYSLSTIQQAMHNTKEIEDEKAEITFSFKERKVDEFGRSFGVGRRKSSHARVALKEGSGQVTVNGKSVVEYFEFHQRKHALEALEYSETAGLYDVDCIVRGGGSTGQAGAMRLGIARALELQDPSFRPILKTYGLLTRDSRVVERKKVGQKKARKKFQWVKR